MHLNDSVPPRLELRLVQHTRVHALHEQPSHQARIWIKREDETPFGTKQRKYASLLPYLRQQGIQAVAMLGSMASNHLVAATQLFRQEGIQTRLVLREGHADEKPGNPLLLQLLTHPSERWVIPRPQWTDAASIASERMRMEFPDAPFMVLPEGAFHPFSVRGAMTLAKDIRENEMELGTSFDHVVLDAGTGLTAAALHAGMAEAGLKGRLHVLVRAGTVDEMEKRFNIVMGWTREMDLASPSSVNDFAFHSPSKGRSFGTVSSEGLDFIQSFARNEGVILDPLYNGPLLQHVLDEATLGHLLGEVLVIHGGGIAAIHGFNDRFTRG